MRQQFSTLAVALLTAIAMLACSDHEGPVQERPGLTVEGRLETEAGSPVGGGTIWLRVWDAGQSMDRADSTLTTDSSGHFAATLPTDSLLSTGYLQADVQPPLGSGLGRAYWYGPITFDAAGRADTSGMLITVTQVAPLVPTGNPAHFDPALLQGDYSGATVPPATIVSSVYLDLSLTPVGDSVYGRYDIDFTASTACGDGNGAVEGQVRNDTLFLRLVSDSFPGWDGITKVNSFMATTYAVSADTLILRYPASSGPCSWGSPAPLRVVRQ